MLSRRFGGIRIPCDTQNQVKSVRKIITIRNPGTVIDPGKIQKLSFRKTSKHEEPHHGDASNMQDYNVKTSGRLQLTHLG